MDLSDNTLGQLLSIGSALTWSVGVIIYRHLGAHIPPLSLNLFKNLIVFILILPTLIIIEGWHWPTISSAEVFISVLSGVLGIAIADTLYLASLNKLDAARLGIIGNLYSPFVLILAFLFLSERLTKLQWGGFALVPAGVFLASQQKMEATLDSSLLKRGLVYGISAIFLMAVAIIMVKQTLTKQPLLWIVTLRMVGGMLSLSIIFLVRGETFLQPVRKIKARQWVILFVAALVGQYISMILWLGGYKYTSASVAAVLNETPSIFILIMAWLFLGEKMTLHKIVGVILTMSGVSLMLLV